jgi:hypothetical protein
LLTIHGNLQEIESGWELRQFQSPLLVTGNQFPLALQQQFTRGIRYTPLHGLSPIRLNI